MMKNNEMHVPYAPFLVTGILSGLLLSFLHFKKPEYYFIFSFIIFYGLFFLFGYSNKRSTFYLLLSTILPSLLISVSLSAVLEKNMIPLSAMLLTIVFAFALNAFHIYYQRTNSGYKILFLAVWDAVIELCIAIFFTLICWLILILTGNLFRIINIHFVDTLISKGTFQIIFSSFCFATGLYIAQSVYSIVYYARRLFLFTCRYLLLPLSVIGILFFVAFVFNQIRYHTALSDASGFLLLVFLSLIFVNAIYGEGNTPTPYPTFLFLICRSFLCLAPLFSLIAIYIILFGKQADGIARIGLTIHHFYYLLGAILIAIYSIAYAIIALKKESPWFISIEKVNKKLAYFLIVTVLVTINPWLIHRFDIKKKAKEVTTNVTSSVSFSRS